MNENERLWGSPDLGVKTERYKLLMLSAVVRSAASATLRFQCCVNEERTALGLTRFWSKDREVQTFGIVSGGEFSRTGHAQVLVLCERRENGFGARQI